MTQHISFDQARAALQLSGAFTRQDLVAAYRRAVRASPPDRDAEAFRQVRAAYELLRHPLSATDAWLLADTPHCPPPLLADPPAPHAGTSLAREAFRRLMRNLDVDALLPKAELDRIDRP